MDCKTVNIKKGSTGATVKELQRYLTFLGYYDGNIDGQCGNYTVNGIKKLQKAYGNTVDGWFGPKTCKNCGINGQDISNSIQAIPVDIFENIIQRFNNFKTEKGREPTISYIYADNHYRYITNGKYYDMLKRYNEYKEKKGKKPLVCYVNKPTTKNSDLTTIVGKMKDAVGDFSTLQGAYNRCKGRGYAHYNNDIYTQDQAIYRLKHRLGINCSDSSQLFYALAVAMGWKARYVHIRCRSGTGHIVLDVRRNSSDRWTRIDPAACLSVGSQYSWGRIWCRNGTVIAYNPGWLLTDDGRT